MLPYILNANSLQEIISYAIAFILAGLVGMTVHEFAHNYVAHLMGDPVPAREGRLTLDPSVHIYLPGFLMFVIIGFGILGTAPIDARRMRNPRWGYLLAVAAGPFSNLLLAIIFGLLIRIIGVERLFFEWPYTVRLIIQIMFVFNVLLFIFNLLPFFPIDGWHIVFALLPPDLAHTWQRNAMTTQYILLGLIFWSFVAPPELNILRLIISGPTEFLQRLLIGF